MPTWIEVVLVELGIVVLVLLVYGCFWLYDNWSAVRYESRSRRAMAEVDAIFEATKRAMRDVVYSRRPSNWRDW